MFYHCDTIADRKSQVDLQFTEKEEAFREEVRSFLRRELPVGWMGAPPWTGESEEGWQFAQELTKKLGKKRWLTIPWPRDYGGLDGSGAEVLIFSEESAYHRAPRVDVMGTGIVGPTILVHGTDEQKKRILRPTARGELIWCQGFTEPNAGSDSASIQTRAVEDGDDYIIQGQKIFISLAHRAHMCYLTARTDPDVPKHRGISYFLIDLKAPGITIHPLLNMAGEHSFNEVFFDCVRVPKENLLGEKNGGRAITMYAFGIERSYGLVVLHNARRYFEQLVQYCKETYTNGQPLAKDPVIRSRLAEMAIEIEVGRNLGDRLNWMASQKMLTVLPSCQIKVHGADVAQRVASLGMQILGLYGQLDDKSKRAKLGGRMEHVYLSSVAWSLAGGTSEISRNIIAGRAGLGLPS